MTVGRGVRCREERPGGRCRGAPHSGWGGGSLRGRRAPAKRRAPVKVSRRQAVILGLAPLRGVAAAGGDRWRLARCGRVPSSPPCTGGLQGDLGGRHRRRDRHLGRRLLPRPLWEGGAADARPRGDRGCRAGSRSSSPSAGSSATGYRHVGDVPFSPASLSTGDRRRKVPRAEGTARVGPGGACARRTGGRLKYGAFARQG